MGGTHHFIQGSPNMLSLGQQQQFSIDSNLGPLGCDCIVSHDLIVSK